MDVNHGQDDNITTEATGVSLKELNDQQTRRFYPVIGFISVAMVIGVFGNLLVICVYCTRFQRTPNNLLIVMLSVFDLLSAALLIPFEIVDMSYPFMHGEILIIPCKIFRFLSLSLISGSALTLGTIAFERFKKITNPLNPLGMSKMRYLMVGVTIFVTTVSIPMIFLYGYHTEDLSSYGAVVNGSDCSIEDRFTNTPYVSIYGVFFLFSFAVYFSMYAYFYTRIALIVRRRQRYLTSPKGSDNNGSVSENCGISREMSSVTSSQSISSKDSRRKIPVLRAVSGVKIRTVRITVMFSVSSIVCVISFLPVLTLAVADSLLHLDDWRMKNPTMDTVFEFCQKSFCINTCSNPIIYSIMNPAFRKACKDFFKSGCKK